MISILLVDHALENPRSIRRLLSGSSNDFKLTCVNSYRKILEGFRSKAYDVCLIDSAADNGLKLFAQARSLGCTAPIVMVTSNDAREAIRAIRDGVADCLIRDDLSAAGIEQSVYSVVEQARSISLQHQHERRYLALLDNANGIVYTHDLKGNFTSINRTGEQIIGYSQGEILEMNVFQIVVPEYRALVDKMIQRTLDAQTQTADQIELVTRYGTKLTVEINTHPIHRDGKIIEVQGIATTTPDGLAERELRRSQSLPVKVQSRATPGENREGQFVYAYDVADNFSDREDSPPINHPTFFQ
jgi:PAS domain S-box-containing protein